MIPTSIQNIQYLGADSVKLEICCFQDKSCEILIPKVKVLLHYYQSKQIRRLRWKRNRHEFSLGNIWFNQFHLSKIQNLFQIRVDGEVKRVRDWAHTKEITRLRSNKRGWICKKKGWGMKVWIIGIWVDRTGKTWDKIRNKEWKLS